MGDRIGALTVWGADAERVCVPEADAVEVPEDLDPAEVVSLVFPYMTAYQVLHRTAKVKRGETVLVHGAAGRVGTAVLELGAVAGLRLLRDRFGSRPRRGRAARRGGDRLPQRGLPGAGARADRATVWTSCSTGSAARCRCAPSARCGPAEGSSCSAATPRSRTGARDWRAVIEWYAATAAVWLWGLLSPRRRVLAYRIQKLATPSRGEPAQSAGSHAPGLVPGGLPRAARAAPRGQDPPGRGRAPAALRGASRARAARELGGEGKARARAVTPIGVADHTPRGARRRPGAARRQGSEPAARPAGSATAVATDMSQKSEASTDVGRFE